MSLIGKEISDFSVQAYQDNDFHTVTKADVLGRWSLFFFYPADFTFVCPTELEDLANLERMVTTRRPAARPPPTSARGTPPSRASAAPRSP